MRARFAARTPCVTSMASSTVVAAVAELERCADPAAASVHFSALAKLTAEDEAAEALLSEPEQALRTLCALSRVLNELGPQLDAAALACACTAVSVVLDAALEAAPDRDAQLLATARGVCVACRRGGRNALRETAAAVAQLASVGTPDTRDVLRAEAAPHIVTSMLGGGLHTVACVALHYLTQDGAAAAVAALPGVGAALAAALWMAAVNAKRGEDVQAITAALVHVAADSECAAQLADAAGAAVVALKTHAADPACVRLLAAAVAKLADAGVADARSPAARAAAARALALHRGEPKLRKPLLAALVAAAAAEEQAASLLAGRRAALEAFTLETRASGIAGAGAGLFVASGEAPAGAVVALYPGEVWAEAPPASVVADNEYLAALPGGGFADGSAAAVARAAAAATAREAPDLGARAAAHMANHPSAGAAPNCIFVELALPDTALQHAPAAAPDGGAPPWVLCLLSVEPLPCGSEVTVDYRIDGTNAPGWYASVAEHLALL